MNFKRAFFPNSSPKKEGHIRLEASGKRIRFVYYSTDFTDIFVIPGLTGGGGYCLTSYESIQKIGEKIAEITGVKK